MPDIRSVDRVLPGRPATDGAGVRMTRVIAAPELDHFDPFLLLDEFRSDDPDDDIAGFPDHPHRGFFVAPGQHVRIARRLGLRRGSVPILELGGEVVQGSADIVTWAESAAPEGTPALSSDETRDACLQIERRLDDVAGVHTRRLDYSEAVIEHPGTVRPLLTAGLPAAQRLGFLFSWRLIRSLMIRGMDLGPSQREASRDIVKGELGWLEAMLADGRQYLAGDRFSRADIAAARLLSPVALPVGHPACAGLDAPPRFAADLERRGDRPALASVREIYAKHR